MKMPTMTVAVTGTPVLSWISAVAAGKSLRRPMANTTRERPSTRLSSTLIMAMAAPTVSTLPRVGSLNFSAMTARESKSWPALAKAIQATPMYNSVVITNVAMMARGMVRRGSATSSPKVATRP